MASKTVKTDRYWLPTFAFSRLWQSPRRLTIRSDSVDTTPVYKEPTRNTNKSREPAAWLALAARDAGEPGRYARHSSEPMLADKGNTMRFAKTLTP
ncbi:hypothetical protein, partial [Paraburkholderia silvatlantica]|uniref:hypothetical protein n=1 Tax=Paraburkholderia silvatlantica TaxID=321895 RepID=UPI001A9C9AB3